MSAHHDRSAVRSPAVSFRPRAVLTGAVLALIGASSVLAGVVGPPIPIWSEPVGSYLPAVAFNLQHEEFLVVWGNLQGPSTWGVYARRVAMDGTPLSWFSVRSAAGEHHSDPTVGYASTRDSYLVCWTADPSTVNPEIACAPVTWDGSSIGAASYVVTAQGSQHEAEIAYNQHHDEFLLVYGNSWSSGPDDVAAQRVAPDGLPISGAIIASGPTSADLRFSVDVAFNADLDEYLFVYQYDGAGTLQGVTRAKTAPYDLGGVTAAPEIDLGPIDGSVTPEASWSSEAYLAVWVGAYVPGLRTMGRHLSEGGVPLGATSGFPISAVDCFGYHTEDNHDVTWAPAIGHVVAYQNVLSAGMAPGVFTRVVSPGSERLLTPQLTVADGPADQMWPAVACAPWGVCLVVYQEDDDIVARILRFHAFADGFDETGDTSYWSVVVP